MSRHVFVLAIASVVLAACTTETTGPVPGSATVTSDEERPDVTGTTPAPGGGPPFAFGVEYMERGLAEIYAATGVTWAKTRLEAFSWGQVEPQRPTGAVHTYDWSTTDHLIGEYQEAGIVHIQSYLESKSGWGSVSIRDVMPKSELMADYRAFVRAIIERYDGDGVDDMPDLVEPVRYWVIGSEWTGFWPSGNAADYLRLLEVASVEARAAYPEVQIGAIPFMLADVFSGNQPSDAVINSRLENPPAGIRNSTEGTLQILDRPELFDYVDIHSLGDYTEIPPTLRWLRASCSRARPSGLPRDRRDPRPIDGQPSVGAIRKLARKPIGEGVVDPDRPGFWSSSSTSPASRSRRTPKRSPGFARWRPAEWSRR